MRMEAPAASTVRSVFLWHWGALQPQHEWAVIEAGISEPGEMERLAHCIRPNFGVLTHLGNAHAETSLLQPSCGPEKLLLFGNCQWVVIPDGFNEARVALEQKGVKVYSWGPEAHHALCVSSFIHLNGRTIEAKLGQQTIHLVDSIHG